MNKSSLYKYYSFVGDLVSGRLHSQLKELRKQMDTFREGYDRRATELETRQTALEGALTTESTEIHDQLAAQAAEIARLRELVGENFDFSRLDAINERLSASATRIGALVEPVPVEESVPGDAPPLPGAEIGTEEEVATEVVDDEVVG